MHAPCRSSGKTLEAGSSWRAQGHPQHTYVKSKQWPYVLQAVAILMLTKSPSDAELAVKRIAVSYPPICEDLIVQIQARIVFCCCAALLYCCGVASPVRYF